MRIAVWHNLPSGGGKRALYYHVKGLAERGHHLEAWCPSSADRNYLPLGDICTEHVLPLPESRGMASVARRYSRKRYLLEVMDRHCRECARQINAQGFDILFANSCLFFATNPIAKYSKIPSVLYLQEPYRLLYEALPRLPWAAPEFSNDDSQTRSRLGNRFKDFVRIGELRIQVREEVKNAAAFGQILVNSLFSRESVGRAYGLESEVCYLGIDTSHFRPTGEPTENYVLGLGGLHFNKGVDRAIRAVAQVPAEKRPQLVWVANFSNPEEESLVRALAGECGVDFALKVSITDAELVSLLSRASLLIYTSRLEPFGYAPLEANACGTPVVAVAEGGVRETVRNEINGLLVEGAAPRQLASAIERIVNDTVLAGKLREQGLKYVRTQWSLAAAIDRLENRLLSTIATRGAIKVG